MFISTFIPAQKTDSIVFRGTYSGKNLYIQDPFAGSGVGLCVTGAKVNNVPNDEECIGGFTYEITFDCLQLKIGDSVHVVIYHKHDCKPKVLNPEVLFGKSTFVIRKMEIDSLGFLKWEADSENSHRPYYIEQFRWVKWVVIGKVEEQGKASGNVYSFKIPDIHSGKNKFRLKQVDYTANPRRSDSLIFFSNKKPITFNYSRSTGKIIFSGETMYEIYDQYGNIVKKGLGVLIEVLNLEHGSYYLNYDNTSFYQFMR